MSAAARYLAVTVDAHMCAETGIRTRVHPRENRVVMALEGERICDVHLYTDRAELVRLRDALTAALTDLDAQRAALAAETDSDTAADSAA